MNIKGVVATGHPETTRVAQQVLEQGGNAFDATVAAYFMACVCEPVLASLGGGGFMVAKHGAHKPKALDFFVQTPLVKKQINELDFDEIVVDFGSTTQAFHMGHGTVAVPGCVKGMFEIHREFCRIPMAQLIAPAVQAAKSGVLITEEQAAILSLVKPIYVNRDSARALFVNNNKKDVLAHGDRYLNADLSQVLEVLSIEGEKFFYQGEIAQAIHDSSRSSGGSITRADLNTYQIQWREPTYEKFGSANVFLNPPPSAGGMLVLFAMKLIAAAGNRNFKSRDINFYQQLARSIELTQQARIEALSFSTHKELEEQNLFNPQMIEKYHSEIANKQKSNNGTTHISVADNQGNVAALTVSNGEGCGEILLDTGIMLNNMLGEDDLNPLGLNRWVPNRRLSSMMCPGIAIKEDSVMAIGSGGSNRIRTAVLQVLVNHMFCDLSLPESVEAARMHFDDKLYLELSGLSESIVSFLKTNYPDLTLFPSRDFYFGGVNTVSISHADCHAVADTRRGGRAVVVS